MSDVVSEEQKTEEAKKITLIVYILQCLGFFFGGITFIIGIIINYVKKDEVQDTIYASHFRWQMRTFWFGVLWSFLGGLLAVFLVGIPILMVTTIWLIYRIVRGMMSYRSGKAMYVK